MPSSYLVIGGPIWTSAAGLGPDSPDPDPRRPVLTMMGGRITHDAR